MNDPSKILPIRTKQRPPTKADGAVIVAWDENHKRFTQATAAEVNSDKKRYCHWMHDRRKNGR